MGLVRVKSRLGYKTLLAGISLYIRQTGCLDFQGFLIIVGYPEAEGSVRL
jgi:hypothetical protein